MRHFDKNRQISPPNEVCRVPPDIVMLMKTSQLSFRCGPQRPLLMIPFRPKMADESAQVGPPGPVSANSSHFDRVPRSTHPNWARGVPPLTEAPSNGVTPTGTRKLVDPMGSARAPIQWSHSDENKRSSYCDGFRRAPSRCKSANWSRLRGQRIPPSNGVTPMGPGDLVAPFGSAEPPVNRATPIKISKLVSPLGPAEPHSNGAIPIGAS